MVRGRQTAPYDVPQCMVFHPTLEEMTDFQKYMEYMESKGSHFAGIAKVIPPPEWIPRKKGYGLEEIKNMVIRKPIKQTFTPVGDKKAYQTKSTAKTQMTVEEYYKHAHDGTYKTPIHKDYDDLERKYWKSIGFVPPIYGADVTDSMSDPDLDKFNVSRLNNILDILEGTEAFAGINTPYLYFGSWKTTFSWHVEDMDLYAVNYLHFGMPKTWYCVPPKYGHLLEKACKKLFPNVSSWCSNFMRHKTCLINPSVLDELGVPYQKVVQEERNMIVVYPYAYHSGFNHGFNCAESTNFALERWIEYGKRYRPCDCNTNTVKLKMDPFIKRFQPDLYEKWASGKDIAPHPEDPPEVADLIMIQAKDPELYSKLMREARQKELEENSQKIFFQTSSGRTFAIHQTTLKFVKGSESKLNEDEKQEFEVWKNEQKINSKIIFQEAGGPLVSEYRRLVHIYQHPQLKQITVKVLPRTLTVIGEGLTMLKAALPNDRFETVKDLIDKGSLIKIGERQLKRKVMKDFTEGSSSLLPPVPNKVKMIDKNILHLKHSYMNLEAWVFEDDHNKYYGDHTNALKTFMEEKSMADLVQCGTFKIVGKETKSIAKVIKPIKAKPLSKLSEEERSLKKPLENFTSIVKTPESVHQMIFDEDVFYLYRNASETLECLYDPLSRKPPELWTNCPISPDETVQEFISENKMTFVKQKKFKKGVKIHQTITYVLVYKHKDIDFEVLINKQTKVHIQRGRAKIEKRECLKHHSVEQLMENGSLVFIKEKCIFDYLTENTAESEKINLKSFVTSSGYHVDCLENSSQTLLRVKDVSSNFENVFLSNSISTLIDQGILIPTDSQSSHDVVDLERLRNVMKCEINKMLRYKFEVKPLPGYTVLTNESKTQIVAKKYLPDNVKALILGKSVTELIMKDILCNPVPESGMTGALQLKRAVLNKRKINPIEIYLEFVEFGVQIKNRPFNELIIIQKKEKIYLVNNNEDNDKPTSNEIIETENNPDFNDVKKIEEDSIDTAVSEKTLAVESLESTVLDNHSPSPIKLLKDDIELDEEDFDDLEDSDNEMNDYSDLDDNFDLSGNSSSDDESYFSDDPDFKCYNGLKTGFKYKTRRNSKKHFQEQSESKNKAKKFHKLASGKSRNLREFVEVSLCIFNICSQKMMTEKDIVFSEIGIQESFGDQSKKSKVRFVLEIFKALNLMEELKNVDGNTVYIWEGNEVRIKLSLQNMMEGSVYSDSTEAALSTELVQLLAPMKKLHVLNMSEIFYIISKKVALGQKENIKLYSIISVFEGLGIIERQSKYIKYIGPDVNSDFILKTFAKYRQNYGLKNLSVPVRKVKVHEKLYQKFIDYIYSKRNNESAIFMGSASEVQKQKAAVTGICQCGIRKDLLDHSFRKKVVIGQRKRTRCNQCDGCKAPKCMQCSFCLNARLKKPCINRKCLNPIPPKCPCFA